MRAWVCLCVCVAALLLLLLLLGVFVVCCSGRARARARAPEKALDNKTHPAHPPPPPTHPLTHAPTQTHTLATAPQHNNPSHRGHALVPRVFDDHARRLWLCVLRALPPGPAALPRLCKHLALAGVRGGDLVGVCGAWCVSGARRLWPASSALDPPFFAQKRHDALIAPPPPLLPTPATGDHVFVPARDV